MSANDLRTAYAKLCAEAERVPYPRLDAAHRDELDWLLVHIYLSEDIITRAARRAAEGLSSVIDNATAMNEKSINSIITSTSHNQRVQAMRCAVTAASNAIDRLQEHDLVRPVQLRIYSRDRQHMQESTVAWREFIGLRIGHIERHGERLRQTRP